MMHLYVTLLVLLLAPVRSLLVESRYRGPQTWVPLARFAIGQGAADKMRPVIVFAGHLSTVVAKMFSFFYSAPPMTGGTPKS